jgi:hypothetical protein
MRFLAPDGLERLLSIGRERNEGDRRFVRSTANFAAPSEGQHSSRPSFSKSQDAQTAKSDKR